MKQSIANVFSTCPPYLLFLGGFGLVLAASLFKLYGILQGMGLGA